MDFCHDELLFVWFKNLYKRIFDLWFMLFKLIHETQAKPGTNIIIDGTPCTVKSNDVSTSGRHGHAKCRIEGIGITDNKKRVR